MASHSRSEQALYKLLKELRLERKLTQIELARKVGERQDVISKIERGHRRLYATQLFTYVKKGFDLQPTQFAKLYEKRV